MNCEDDIEAPNTSNIPDNPPIKKSLFHRSKVHSSTNGSIMPTISQEVEIRTEDSVAYQPSCAPTEPQEVIFSEVNQAALSSNEDVKVFHGVLPKISSSVELDVGLEISPTIERRNSNSLL